jgi:hypothetical protein
LPLPAHRRRELSAVGWKALGKQLTTHYRAGSRPHAIQPRRALRLACSQWVDLDADEVEDIHVVEAEAGGWAFARVMPTEVEIHGVHLRKAYHYAKQLEGGATFPPVQVESSLSPSPSVITLLIRFAYRVLGRGYGCFPGHLTLLSKTLTLSHLESLCEVNGSDGAQQYRQQSVVYR